MCSPLRMAAMALCIALAACSPEDPASNAAPSQADRPGGSQGRELPPAERALLEADWPTFRGDAGQSGVAGGALPDTLQVLWTRDIASGISAPAIIVGDSIYIGTDDEKIVALNLADGTQRWEFATSDMIEAAPGYRDGRVFVGDLAGYFYALDAKTGEKLWSHETDGQISSSANFHDKAVLVGSYDFNLYSFNIADGTVNWTFENVERIHCSPCVVGGTAGISGCDGALHIIDLADGTERAAIPLGGYVVASPAHRDGMFFAATYTGDMVAARADKVDPVWAQIAEGGGVEFYASPAAAEDRVIFAGRDGIVRCLDREKGDVIWTYETDFDIDSSPVVAGERVYFGCGDGKVYGLSLEDGREVWSYEAGGSFVASPAVGRGVLVIGNSDGALYCFGAQKGDPAR